ncbi:hypothetical protein GCM10009681_09080 [Luedemannella helvata]|uniref:Uncharacterized protein n=1 Tax=Luedemannella helvata TaxID=349315 RepID=A0ABP4VWR8_9ACTN
MRMWLTRASDADPALQGVCPDQHTRYDVMIAAVITSASTAAPVRVEVP